jgi:fumarylacetoacetase
MEALEPYRVPLHPRATGDPEPLAYLSSAANRDRGAIDAVLEVELTTAQMRDSGVSPFRLSRGNLKNLYWSIAQMVAHHTSNGCNLRAGDLLATGTVSGPDKESRGCLLELTRRGADAVSLPTGEARTFLEAGDEITLRGYCERDGLPRIGLGECTGRVI